MRAGLRTLRFHDSRLLEKRKLETQEVIQHKVTNSVAFSLVLLHAHTDGFEMPFPFVFTITVGILFFMSSTFLPFFVSFLFLFYTNDQSNY